MQCSNEAAQSQYKGRKLCESEKQQHKLIRRTITLMVDSQQRQLMLRKPWSGIFQMLTGRSSPFRIPYDDNEREREWFVKDKNPQSLSAI